MQVVIDNWQSIVAVAGALGMIVSEILPFVSNAKAQGILHGVLLVIKTVTSKKGDNAK